MSHAEHASMFALSPPSPAMTSQLSMHPSAATAVLASTSAPPALSSSDLANIKRLGHQASFSIFPRSVFSVDVSVDVSSAVTEMMACFEYRHVVVSVLDLNINI